MAALARSTAADTPTKILRAGERLFAQQGFDRVPLREIARVAGQKNVAAVQYHFGSKEGLLEAILDDHRREIDQGRAALLTAAEAEGAGQDLTRLTEILVEPLAAKLDSPSGRAYLQIQAQGLGHAEMRPATRSLVRRIGRQIAPVEGGDPHQARLALLLLLHALADRAREESARRASRADRSAFVETLTRSLRALLAS